MEENDRRLKESYDRLKMQDDRREAEISRLSEDLASAANTLKEILNKMETGNGNLDEIERAVRETVLRLEKINKN